MESIKQKYLSIVDASNYLDLSLSSVYKFTMDRRIPFYKIGRKIYFEKNDLDEFIKRNRQASRDEVKHTLNLLTIGI